MSKFVKSVTDLLGGTEESIKKVDTRSERSKNTLYFFVYTVAFAIVALIVFSWYLRSGKSFIWFGTTGRGDGLTQHFNALLYFGRYLRSIAKTLFSTGRLVIPAWDFNLGLGSDVMTTLNYYVIGDPLNLLSAFVRSKDTEKLYCFLIILRLYLSGIAFSLFCFRMKKGRFATLASSFVYVFCGYAIVASVRHPYFINPMIYLPLLLIGVEKLFARQKPTLFIIIVFLCTCSNFYFLYMVSIFMVLYAVFRYFDIYRKLELKQLVITVVPFIVFYLVGLLMACALFLPVVKLFLTSGRIDTGYTFPFFYDLNYYSKILPSFISLSSNCGNWTLLGYSSISLIAVVVLFCQKKKHTALKIAFILLSLFILFPIVGRLFNGFSYVANRWTWGYSMLVAYILATVIPYMPKLTKKTVYIILAVLSVFAAYCLSVSSIKITATMIFCFLLLVTTVVVICILKKRPKLFKSAILSITIIGIIVNACCYYSPKENNYVRQFADNGAGLTSIYQSQANAVTKLKDNSFYRYEENTDNQFYLYNSSLNLGLNSASYFWSLIPGSISNYVTEMELNISDYSKLTGFDGRAMMGLLSSTKYFVTKKSNTAYVPFGYSIKKNWTNKDKVTYSVYENNYALPLGYTYSSYITHDSYDSLSPVQKQQALLQGVLLEKEQPSYNKTTLNLNDKELNYKLSCSKGVTVNNGKISVTEKKAKLTISFAGKENSETYLSFENLWYNYKSSNSEDKFTTDPQSTSISVNCNNLKRIIFVATPSYNWYINKHNFTTNMGFNKTAINKIDITFNSLGDYTYDDIKIVCQPMDNFAEQSGRLHEDVLQNVNISGNTVTGTIDLDHEKILCLSIPYNGGWKATVDGKAVELLQANTMYMAIPLTSGKHNIQLTYTTPGIKIGLTASGVGILCFVVISVIANKKSTAKRKNKKVI